MSEGDAPESDFREATASTTATPSTLLEALAARTRLSWYTDVAAVGAVLILLLVGTAYLDGVLAGPFDGQLWTVSLMYVAMLVYVLAIQPILGRLRDRAIAAFRPLVPLSDGDFQRLLVEAPLFNRRREWLAVAIGIVGGLLLTRPWTGVFSSFWLGLYGVFLVGLLYGVSGWFIYVSLAGTRLFDKLHDYAADINAFELKSLEPIAHWSLGIALAYIGSMTFSLLVTFPYLTLSAEPIIGYGMSVLVTVAVFFLNMMSTHRIMVEAKKRELKLVRDNLAAASRALHEQTAQGKAEDLGPLADFVDTWLAYEKRVEAVPEWPYTTAIIRNLVLSLLLPGVIGFAQEALSQVFEGFMPPS